MKFKNKTSKNNKASLYQKKKNLWKVPWRLFLLLNSSSPIFFWTYSRERPALSFQCHETILLKVTRDVSLAELDLLATFDTGDK